MKSELSKKARAALTELILGSLDLSAASYKVQDSGLTPTNQDLFIEKVGDILAVVGIIVEELEIPMEVLKAAHDSKLSTLSKKHK